MRELLSATNVDAATADYPNGRVRDKVGATPGTTYNEILVGDLYQLFQKLIIDSGITENGLPDNVTNGYQLLEALNSKIRNRYNYVEKSANYDWSAASEKEIDFVKITGSPTIELTLPDPAIYPGRELIFNGGTGTIGYTGDIEGVSYTNNTGTGYGTRLRLISDGTTWRIANIPYNGV